MAPSPRGYIELPVGVPREDDDEGDYAVTVTLMDVNSKNNKHRRVMGEHVP